MAHLSNQTANDLKKATEGLLNMAKATVETFKGMNEGLLKNMSVEDAKKYSNFVKRSAEVGVEQAVKEAAKNL